MIGRYTTGACYSTGRSGGESPQPSITYISCEGRMQYRTPCFGDICLVKKEIRTDARGFGIFDALLRESEPLLIENGIVERPKSLVELVVILEGCEA